MMTVSFAAYGALMVLAAVQTVRDSQAGGIFIGGNATDLLKNQALREVQAVARIPVAVSVDDEGGRVQRIDALDGDLPSARAMAPGHSPRTGCLDTWWGSWKRFARQGFRWARRRPSMPAG